MIVTIHYRDEDEFTFECETIEKARGIANRETAKRGWNEQDCWSEVERSEDEDEYQGQVENSDLWFALAVLLCAFEKDGFSLFALGLGLFCMVSKIFGAFLIGFRKKHKREKRSKTGGGK